jgi:hypothetical protein
VWFIQTVGGTIASTPWRIYKGTTVDNLVHQYDYVPDKHWARPHAAARSSGDTMLNGPRDRLEIRMVSPELLMVSPELPSADQLLNSPGHVTHSICHPWLFLFLKINTGNRRSIDKTHAGRRVERKHTTNSDNIS